MVVGEEKGVSRECGTVASLTSMGGNEEPT